MLAGICDSKRCHRVIILACHHLQKYPDFLAELKFKKANVNVFAVTGDSCMGGPRNLFTSEVGILSLEAELIVADSNAGQTGQDPS